MPLSVNEDLPTKFPNPSYLTLDTFKKGVITLIDQSRLPRDALKEADNILLAEDGMPTIRPGVGWVGNAPVYYSTGTAAQSGLTVTGTGTTFTSAMVGMTITYSTGETGLITGYTSATSIAVDVSQTVADTTYEISAPIQGMDYFDDGGDIHLVAVAGGVVYRSEDDADTWDTCTGATLDMDADVNMNQYNAYLYLTNGVDEIVRYDGSTTLATYAALATPSAPSVAKTGLTGTGYTYYYKVARVNEVGFSIASAATSQVQTAVPREQWDATTNYLVLTPPAGVATQTRTDIYISTDNLDYYYLSSVTTTDTIANTFKDDGSAIIIPSTLAPTASTATGPEVAELTNVGSRMYGVRDPANRYRIWFTSATYPGAFSTAYDGGYLDWVEGGKLIPKKVVDYRDGKGTPYATVFCDSADGQGGILQMSLDLFTAGDVSVTIPSAYLLPGSRGTPSPGSVVNVLNDYMFYNSQAFYNLGSRAQFLNLLSTDEASANIRPTVKQITTADEPTIASVYYDAKVFFSVPNSGYTIVYDTERKAWLPRAFTIGFKKFLRYTDTTGSRRLLAFKEGDTRLSEISSSIQGDYGEPFSTSLVTGLYPVSKNRFEFQWTERGEVEFSNPQGTVSVELLGIERSAGFLSANTETIEVQTTGLGWDTFDWDTMNWDDTSVVPDTYSSSTEKRYFNVNRELNAIQWRITTTSLAARYTLRTLQTWGTDTMGGLPRSWKL